LASAAPKPLLCITSFSFFQAQPSIRGRTDPRKTPFLIRKPQLFFSMYMLTRLFHYSVALGLSAVVLFSCQGKDGDPGPQGDAGVAGAQGQPGSRPNGRIKDGFVKGTITGFRADGVTPLNETFAFEFNDTRLTRHYNYVRETNKPNVYEFNIRRVDSVGRSSFEMTFRAPLSVSADTVTRMELSYNRDLSANQVLGVEGFLQQPYGKPTTVRLTNLAYDQNTGLLTGDIGWNVTHEAIFTEGGTAYNYSGSERPFRVTASFSVRAPRFSSFRKGVNVN
jgi:hypothetical protein